MTETYNVTARHWEHGWELYLDGDCVTQVRTLAKAEQQIRDYLETINDRSFDDAKINVRVELGGIEAEAAEAREAIANAAAAQKTAAIRSRSVARKLRHVKKLSVSDTAVILGVSPGRVSQLAKV